MQNKTNVKKVAGMKVFCHFLFREHLTHKYVIFH